SLCEYAILGFELGYSMTNPNVLVLWEAQFGDFLDTGQVVVDTYISSSEVKWDRQLSIVLLLPHGLEGQGPEHSSARMERFLQMCDDDPDDMPCLKNETSIVNQLREVNWIVAVPTTPANYFHILRRHLKMPFRKPLILFTPKQILKTNRLRSSLNEMTEGTSALHFKRVIPDNGAASKSPKTVKRLIFCTGRVYYDLIFGREERKLQQYIAITRIEQLCPFPYDLVQEQALKYPNAEICWTQEEHKNSGAWSYIYPRFSTALQDNDRDKFAFNVLMLNKKYHSSLNEESFMNSTSSSYMEEMFNLWLKDRTLVHASWDSYFRRILKGALPGQAYQSPPTIKSTVQVATMPPISETYVPSTSPKQQVVPTPQASTKKNVDKGLIYKHQLLMSVITAYQNRGHLVAKLDPLEFTYSYYGAKKPVNKLHPPERIAINSKINELTKDDFNTVFDIPHITFIGGDQTSLPLHEIIQRLENVYCKNIGVEMSHIESDEILEWIKKKFELPNITVIGKERKKNTLEELVASEKLEEFLDRKWRTQPRFGLEGGETLVPGILQIIDSSAVSGAECIIIGTSHRGRINLLANVCKQPLELIFAEFFNTPIKENNPYDVKYHLGSSTIVHNDAANKLINIVMQSNPSHLEIVNPLTAGRARAEQKIRKDTDGNKVVSIILHGDAGISGEGIVYESFNLAELPCYSTSGTIHIVCNNQIGYTTFPHFGRSPKYCTAVAKIMDTAIFHVNNDVPDAVMYCCQVAAEFRNTFHKDVIVDIIGYRRRGHSETDDPVPTAPVLYKEISHTPNVMKKYSKKLIGEK
ncbi:hypothetical protein L9F63_005780, partial [Diploptera punctata]